MSPKNAAKSSKVNALSWAKKAIGLHGCEKATLVKIADNIRDIVNDECYKAIPNIANEHGISARTLEYGLTGRTDRKTGKRVVRGLESRGILVAVGGKKGGGFRYDDEGRRCGITTHWKINIPILLNYLSNANAKALREKLGWGAPKPPTLPTDEDANEPANDPANESANESANQSAKVEASVRKSGCDESAKVGKSVRNIADNILSTSSPEKSCPDKTLDLSRDDGAELPRVLNPSTSKPAGKEAEEVGAAVFTACKQPASEASIRAMLKTCTATEIIDAFKAYAEPLDDNDRKWAPKVFFKDGSGKAIILARKQEKAAKELAARNEAASIEAGRAAHKVEQAELLRKRREDEEAVARLGENPF